MKIKKINKGEDIKLNEFDVLLVLPSGMYLYNMNSLDKEELKNFIKEENLFSDERIKALTFITK